MKAKVQITSGMLTALIVNLVYAKAIGMTQGIMAREVGQDIWLASIFSTIQGVAIMALTVWAIRRAGGRGTGAQADLLFGKWVGKFVHLLLGVFFAGAFVSISITYVYHLLDYFLPEMPIWLFIAAEIVVAVYTIFHGLEVTGRMAVLGVFSILALNILLFFGSIRDFDTRQLLPLFERGFLRTVWASRQNDTDWAMATVMVGMLLPFVAKKKEWMVSSLAGILYGGVVVLLWPLLEVGVLSAPETAHYIVACMQMARSAEIGNFIHRYEMIMVAFFAISLIVQSMVTLFCASIATADLFGMKDYRPAVIPVSLVLGGLAYYVVCDHFRAMWLLADWWPWLSLPIAIGLPVILLVVGFLRKGVLKRPAPESS